MYICAVVGLYTLFRNFFRNIGGVWQLRILEYSAEYRGCFTSFLYSKSGISSYSSRFEDSALHILAVLRFHFAFTMSKQLMSWVDCWFRIAREVSCGKVAKKRIRRPLFTLESSDFCSTRVWKSFSVRIFREYSENIVGWQQDGKRIWEGEYGTSARRITCKG